MEPLAYHVLHEGRRMGPYDRRTIVGLRIKKTLSSADQLEASDGSRLSVAELIGRRPPASEFNALRSGGYTSARHICSASLVGSEPGAVEVLPFRGEVEVRVHADVLRIAGSYRIGRAIKEGRVKFPLKDIAFVRIAGSLVDLWLRAGEAPAASLPLQRLVLDLFSNESAASARGRLCATPRSWCWTCSATNRQRTWCIGCPTPSLGRMGMPQRYRVPGRTHRSAAGCGLP